MQDKDSRSTILAAVGAAGKPYPIMVMDGFLPPALMGSSYHTFGWVYVGCGWLIENGLEDF